MRSLQINNNGIHAGFEITFHLTEERINAPTIARNRHEGPFRMRWIVPGYLAQRKARITPEAITQAPQAAAPFLQRPAAIKMKDNLEDG